MGVRRLAVALLLCWPVLVSCTDDDPGSQPADPTRSATVEPIQTGDPAPTESTGPPVMPPIASENTTAGAEAFVGHFLATVSFAMRTGRSEYARALSLESCRTCSSVLKRVDKIYGRGARVKTRGWTARAMIPDPSKPESTPVIATRVHQGAQVLTGPGDEVIDRDPAMDIPMDIALERTESGWRGIAVLVREGSRLSSHSRPWTRCPDSSQRAVEASQIKHHQPATRSH